MHSPRDAYDNPSEHWGFFTALDDQRFEGQHFERKEAGRPGPAGTLRKSELKRLRREDIAPAISAFANANRDGGLLVLGIASDGTVAGLNHLDEEQRKSIATVKDLLTGHAAVSKFYPCTNSRGEADHVCLFYVPYSERALCETLGDHRAWERTGAQNLPVGPDRRDALRREKGVVDGERVPACVLELEDLDQGVVRELRETELAASTLDRTDEEMLRAVGAIEDDRNGRSVLTTAGALFFMANPQRVLPWATIRLVRYGFSLTDRESGGLPDFDRELSGPVTSQIRGFREFVRDTGFFKTYQRRRPQGGFVDEPELPEIALDEAVVNAVAHRDYAIQSPILCEKYADAFVVQSPGTVTQRNEDLPAKFTLADRRLEPHHRNPFLMRWLKSIQDARGKRYVLALAEGTRRMQREMAGLELPPPIYELDAGRTTLTLISNAPDREAALRQRSSGATATEFVNLFPLAWTGVGAQAVGRPPATATWRRELLESLRTRLSADGWYAEQVRKGKLVAHQRGRHIAAPAKVLSIVRVYPAYEFHPRVYGGRAYLCIDYRAVVQTVVSVERLLRLGIEAADLLRAHAVARWNEAWMQGRITELGADFCKVHLFGPESEESIDSTRVVPRLSRALLDTVLDAASVSYDLPGEIRKASLAVQPKAARMRSERTVKLAQRLASGVFPLKVGDAAAVLDPEPTALRVGDPTAPQPLTVGSLEEPAAEFHDGRALPNIREGITRYGAYNHSPRDVEIVPVCAAPYRDRMSELIERLRKGKMRYQGSERTFSVRLHYGSIVTTSRGGIYDEVARLLDHHPEWVGDSGLTRVFLVHTPEAGYALDDETSPYYHVKRLLLENGVPCQMVDTPTLAKPDYKDLNLALNITAKAGVTPWVLPASIPDADFFIGLSYTASAKGEGRRLMGFANVFNAYGRWEFYSGSGEPFPYEERLRSYQELIRVTLQRLDRQLSETPRVHFHYSARFSREDKAALLEAARSVRERGTYTFVWVNSYHPVRLYDSRPEGDGSLARGRFVAGERGQVYLSTTGFNPYRSVLGTPRALELNAYTADPQRAGPTPDLRALATQVLSLTKLNWASTDSLCAEPITTKYAADIAYLTAAFLRQGGRRPFRLHAALERTPWFI